jgi:hypothetical protein
MGSLCWTAVALWSLWSGEETRAQSVLATLASAFFVVYGSLLLVMWRKEKLAGLDGYVNGGTGARIERIDWFLLSTSTFWLGALGDLCTSLIELAAFSFDEDSADGARVLDALAWLAFATDVVGSHMWLVSGFFDFVEWRLERRARRFHAVAVQFTMAPPAKGDAALFDWVGWAGLMFVPGSLGYVIGAYVCVFTDSYLSCWWFQLIGSFGFLLDSLFQMVAIQRRQDTHALSDDAVIKRSDDDGDGDGDDDDDDAKDGIAGDDDGLVDSDDGSHKKKLMRSGGGDNTRVSAADAKSPPTRKRQRAAQHTYATISHDSARDSLPLISSDSIDSEGSVSEDNNHDRIARESKQSLQIK